MDEIRFNFLRDRFRNDALSANELEEFRLMIISGRYDDLLATDIETDMRSYGLHPLWTQEKQRTIWKTVLRQSTPQRPAAKFSFTVRTLAAWTAAAAVIVALSIGLYHITAIPGDKQRPGHLTSRFGDDMPAPKHARSLLTLADGSRIALDSVANGSFVQQGNAVISKQGEKLTYNTRQAPAAGSTVSWNTLSVPRAGTPTQLSLADGSQVWLNVGSSITYPTAFHDAERQVLLTGEAYFEIAKDPERKFVVKAGDCRTTVLGTHFNITSYTDDDATRITLLEGRVIVNRTASPETIHLQPGQQARSSIDRLSIDKDPDLEQVMAWKNGLFYFDRTNIQAIMRQLSRWYDADIVYQDNVKNMDFSGTISCNNNISGVLRMLEMTGAVHFRITGKTVYVMK